ncbi:hypothetical protein TNCV_1779191 [Trichonephila clavipes]|nr:hypothetical protein TNCV_1779191 [Trichonephila clavipes]
MKFKPPRSEAFESSSGHGSRVVKVSDRGWPCHEFEQTTRRFLATDHVILNNGQVTWTTSELAPPSPNYPNTPTEGHFSSR